MIFIVFNSNCYAYNAVNKKYFVVNTFTGDWSTRITRCIDESGSLVADIALKYNVSLAIAKKLCHCTINDVEKYFPHIYKVLKENGFFTDDKISNFELSARYQYKESGYKIT